LKKKVRFFESPAPTREVSIVYSRSYLKKSIIEALHKKIVSSLPKEYRQPLSETRVVKLPSFR